MNYFDPLIIILIAWAAYRGFSRGLVVMIAAFFALIAGVWGAAKFSGLTGDWMAGTLNVSSPYMGLVSFTITFIVIVIAINIAAWLFSRFLDAIALGFINRLLGGLFSILTMALALSVFLVIIDAFDQRHDFMPEDQVEGSSFYEPVKNLAPTLFPFLKFEDLAREIETLISEDLNRVEADFVKRVTGNMLFAGKVSLQGEATPDKGKREIAGRGLPRKGSKDPVTTGPGAKTRQVYARR